MPTCKINIDSVDEGAGKAQYSDGGGPGDVAANGDIEFNAAIPNLELEFTLTVTGYTFADPGFTAVEISPFGPPSNNTTPPDPPPADTVCTVPDNNINSIYEYTLHLINSDGAPVTIHPKIINR